MKTNNTDKPNIMLSKMNKKATTFFINKSFNNIKNLQVSKYLAGLSSI